MLKAMFPDQPFYGWYGVDDDGDKERTYQDRLFDESVNYTYSGVEEAFEHVDAKIMADGPYDVLLGFSQGTIVTTGVCFPRKALIPRRASIALCVVPRRALIPRRASIALVHRQPLTYPVDGIWYR